MADNDFYNKPDEDKKKTIKTLAKVAAVGAVCAAVGFIATRYRVAGSTEYIVRTGLGIKDISITKQAFQFPFQKCKILNMEPITFDIEVDAMSKQRIPFRMPSVWTIGPRNDMTSLQNYSRLLIDKGQRGLRETVEGIIQGEARILTANMELDSLFHDRENFKNVVTSSINNILDDLGLTVYNANIAELADLDLDNRYFFEQKQRALQEVNQKARVDVAEALREGECGEKRNVTETRKKIAEYEKDAKIAENERDKEVAESEKNLEIAKAEYYREKQVALIEAKAAAEQRNWELQQNVEKLRASQEVERLRASEWTLANVKADISVREAEGVAQAVKLQADAALYAKQKEAEGILAMKNAEATGLQNMMSALGNDGNVLSKYLLISGNQLPILAEKQAEALRGLSPKINIWNTGAQDGTTSNISKTITDLVRTGIPLFEGLKDQTGYDFLSALPKENKKANRVDDHT